MPDLLASMRERTPRSGSVLAAIAGVGLIVLFTLLPFLATRIAAQVKL